ncbi:hypothetical protein R1sor_001875 [Riccia sorocarpa]|uniref:Uncharacterized protein n=1 Tax=Riccia sorocarpa TaxID=122646 RepID=A0ABD3GX64_9MARC
MVGYCLKDRHELHFLVCMKEITDAVQREGRLLSTFYGAANLKNNVELNPSNIMQRALQYNKFFSHYPLGTSFHGCIRRMLVVGHYTPSTSWLIKGMDLTRMNSLWKAYIQPGTITMADVKNVFFWLPQAYPSRFVEGVHPGLHILKASVLEDMQDSDHSDFHPERVSGNPASHETNFASFIPLVPVSSVRPSVVFVNTTLYKGEAALTVCGRSLHLSRAILADNKYSLVGANLSTETALSEDRRR